MHNLNSKKVVFFFLIISFFKISYSQKVYPDYFDGSLYLKIKDTSSLVLSPYNYSSPTLNALFTAFGVDVVNIKRPFPDASLSLQLSKTYRLHFTDSSHVDSLIKVLQLIPSIEYAEKDPIMFTTFIPNDVNANQWYISKIGAYGAWDITHGSTNIVVAIVDNGMRISHSDLSANVWTNKGETAGNLLDDDLNGYSDDIHGFDVADNDNNPNPPASTTNSSPFVHGTHTAGIACGSTNNSKGIASIGFNTKIMAVKCTPDADKGDMLTNAYDGVYYAIRAHADVISMSWGGGTSTTGQTMMNTAHQQGITLVAAAGNSNNNVAQYPAAYQYVVAVGATDQNDLKAGYSNYGTYVDVMAPGSDIYSTLAGDDNSYGTLSGTSMATPLVAGLCALVKATHPTYNPAQIEAAIISGCDKIESINPGFAGMLGAGRINATKTLTPLGVITTKTDHSVSIYPNPAENKITIDFKKNNYTAVEIYDFKCNIVYTQSISNSISGITLNPLNLPPGVYSINLLSDTNSHCRQTIVVTGNK